MTIKKETKQIVIMTAAIILIVAAIDYQSWILEQLHHIAAIPLQFMFTLEAIIVAGLALWLHRVFKSVNVDMTVKSSGLSDREKEVLQNILEGKTNRQIESDLFIEKSTLKSHINRIYKKLNVENRNELIDRFSTS